MTPTQPPPLPPGRSGLAHTLPLAIAAALGGLLFGFDIAIITGAGPFLERHFKLGHLALGWAFSSLLFGCVLGAAAGGWASDRFGRRGPLLWVAALFALTSVATGIAPSFSLFIVARLLGGIAVGAVSVLAPLYVSEISPAASRGRMGAIYQLAIVVGILVSYCINYLLRDAGDWNWRWMFLSGAVPSLVFFLMLRRSPETPRYLIKAGRPAEARVVLSRIDGAQAAETECVAISASMADGAAGWDKFRAPGLRRALRASFFLAILIHVSGVNTVIDYAPRIFQSAGWTIDTALLSTFLVGGVNLLFTLVSFWMIDRCGRKPCYLVGSLGMAAALSGLLVCALTGHFAGPKVLVFVLLYLAFFASCIGPVFWTLVPEIFPNRVRGEAMTVPVLTQWLANALVVLLFPWAFSVIGKEATFGFLAVMCLCQGLFSWRFLPETKGRTLEEIEGFWARRAG
ncbi:MAG TPA: sugar porter family MFS transporter [Opitutaceae bacterium]|jgi:SP family arabinose:H+ symporter-like MFS transporter|nr:sugar porter family MFS transporter [Opitutaceae bacterium]